MLVEADDGVDPPGRPVIDKTAGGSAQAEYERRAARKRQVSAIRRRRLEHVASPTRRKDPDVLRGLEVNLVTLDIRSL